MPVFMCTCMCVHKHTQEYVSVEVSQLPKALSPSLLERGSLTGQGLANEARLVG